jgi:hypothetical protein
MLLNNYAIRNANQSRALGGNLDPTYNYNLNRMYTFYVGDNNVVDVTNRTSIPNSGYRPPYSLVLPPKAGGMSAHNTTYATVSSVTGSGQLGFNISGDTTVTVTGEAVLQLVASLQADGSVTVTATGDGVGVASSPATANVSVVGTLDIVGVGGLLAQATVVASPTADIQATGSMRSMVYLNQSEATVAQIADAVVQAIVDMGATGGLTTEEHAQLMKTLTTGKFIALK